MEHYFFPNYSLDIFHMCQVQLKESYPLLRIIETEKMFLSILRIIERWVLIKGYLILHQLVLDQIHLTGAQLEELNTILILRRLLTLSMMKNRRDNLSWVIINLTIIRKKLNRAKKNKKNNKKRRFNSIMNQKRLLNLKIRKLISNINSLPKTSRKLMITKERVITKVILKNK